MKCFFLSLCLGLGSFSLFSQENQGSMQVSEVLPYYEIPDHPDEFTAETVVARMIDGLGFRYYWATEGLRPEDLAFRPSKGARTSEETIDHILGLTYMILNPIRQTTNSKDIPPITFAEKRRVTLHNLKAASDILKNGKGTLDDYPFVSQRNGKRRETPFWNQINGPIADAIWHVGQVVTFRRSSGNPFNAKVSVFSGRVRE